MKRGLGTRHWTPEQMETLLNIGVNGDELTNAGRAFQLDEDGIPIVDTMSNRALTKAA